jgi:uncharacterized membrane protein YfcA
VFVAYFIFGVTGFGSSIISVPVLVLFFPLQVVVPIMVILDLCAAFYLGTKSFGDADKKELTWLLPFSFVGMVIGITLLLKSPPEPLLITLGIFAALNGLRVLMKKKSSPLRTISRYWSVPFGVIGGVFTSLFATGGPIYASYLAMRLHQPNTLRATMAFAILIFVFLRLIFMVVTGLILDWHVLILALFLVPCMVLGLRGGSRAHQGLSMHAMQLVYGSILLFAGIVLLIKQIF